MKLLSILFYRVVCQGNLEGVRLCSLLRHGASSRGLLQGGSKELVIHVRTFECLLQGTAGILQLLGEVIDSLNEVFNGGCHFISIQGWLFLSMR